MGIEGGVFGVARNVFEHPLLSDLDRNESYNHTLAWLWIVRKAAHAPKRVRVCGTWVHLERTHVACSLRFLAGKWKWSVHKVRKFLRVLIKDGMIVIVPKTTGSHTRGTATSTPTRTPLTIISICNFDVYQIAPLPTQTATSTPESPKRAQKEELRKEIYRSEAGSGSELADKVYAIFEFDPQFLPPGWCGFEHHLRGRLAKKEWEPDVVVYMAEKTKSKLVPDSYVYLQRAIDGECRRLAKTGTEIAHVVRADRSQRELPLVRTIKGGGFTILAAQAARRAAGFDDSD